MKRHLLLFSAMMFVACTLFTAVEAQQILLDGVNNNGTTQNDRMRFGPGASDEDSLSDEPEVPETVMLPLRPLASVRDHHHLELSCFWQPPHQQLVTSPRLLQVTNHLVELEDVPNLQRVDRRRCHRFC